MAERSSAVLPPEKTHSCVIRYSRSSSSIGATENPAVLIAVKAGPTITFYAHRDIKAVVSEEEFEYYAALIPDLVARSRESADAVFEQLKSLSAGKLRADEVAQIDPGDDAVLKLYPEMVRVG